MMATGLFFQLLCAPPQWVLHCYSTLLKYLSIMFLNVFALLARSPGNLFYSSADSQPYKFYADVPPTTHYYLVIYVDTSRIKDRSFVFRWQHVIRCDSRFANADRNYSARQDARILDKFHRQFLEQRGGLRFDERGALVASISLCRRTHTHTSPDGHEYSLMNRLIARLITILLIRS